MGQYLRPTSVDAALRALAADRLTIIAGGTDFYPARVGRPLCDDVLDLGAVDGLRASSISPISGAIPTNETISSPTNACAKRDSKPDTQ